VSESWFGPTYQGLLEPLRGQRQLSVHEGDLVGLRRPDGAVEGQELLHDVVHHQWCTTAAGGGGAMCCST